LHVLGYDHPDGPGRTRSPMWRLQERYMRRLFGAGLA
jgi:ssRNA-specific RNase YbeY (16S rRNA maturation enzyme)